jgi:hypothetical protein
MALDTSPPARRMGIRLEGCHVAAHRTRSGHAKSKRREIVTPVHHLFDGSFTDYVYLMDVPRTSLGEVPKAVLIDGSSLIAQPVTASLKRDRVTDGRFRLNEIAH